MRLIIDTNIIFSALIKNSLTREILLSPNFKFYTPDFYIVELKKYKSEILKKFEGTENELDELIKLLHEKIIIVVEDEYSEKMKEADGIIGKVDPKDIPFIALALSIENDGIWTRDQHFIKQNSVDVYSTEELIKFYKEKKSNY